MNPAIRGTLAAWRVLLDVAADDPDIMFSAVQVRPLVELAERLAAEGSRDPVTCWRCGGGLDASFGPPAEPICDACYAIVVGERLYGEPDAEYLQSDLDGAIESWFASCNLEPADVRLPLTITLHEYTVLPLGESGDGKVASAEDIVEWVVERFADDCGFEELFEQYDESAKRPEVIAAFEAARAALIAYQRFRVADRSVRKIDVTFTAVDEHLMPTWTVGEWIGFAP